MRDSHVFEKDKMWICKYSTPEKTSNVPDWDTRQAST